MAISHVFIILLLSTVALALPADHESARAIIEGCTPGESDCPVEEKFENGLTTYGALTITSTQTTSASAGPNEPTKIPFTCSSCAVDYGNCGINCLVQNLTWARFPYCENLCKQQVCFSGTTAGVSSCSAFHQSLQHGQLT